MAAKRISVEELLALGPTTDVETAGKAFSLCRNAAYAAHMRGDLPVDVIRVGRNLRVTRSSLLAALGIEDQR